MSKLTLAGFVTALLAFSALAQGPVPASRLTHRGTLFADAAISAKPQTVVVPAETEVNIEVLSGIHTRINRVNDPVMAMVLKPVLVRGKIALPPGSLLDGRITTIRNSGHMHRAAEVGLRFDRITLPDGQEKPIAAALAGLENPEKLDFHLDAEGHLVGNHTMSWKTIFGGVGALGTFGALKIAAVGSTGVSLLLPAGGAAIIGYEALWRRGREVNVPPDTECLLRLNYPLTVRIAW